MLVGIFLLSNVACDSLTGLVITQLDTKNNLANPFEIVKIDKKKCTIKVKDLEPHPILSEKMHGAYCLSDAEFAKYKARLQADCKTDNETKKVQ